MDLLAYLQSAKRSLFRFEYLQDFDVPEEHELSRKYELGRAQIIPIMKDWWDFLDQKHQEGVTTQRVRLVRLPMSQYVKWELQIHLETVKHGDDIRTLPELKLTPELEKLGDFWVIDDSTAIEMQYDFNGKYVGCREASVASYHKAKEYLIENSIPLTPELLTKT